MQFYNVYFLFIFSFFSVLKEARAQTVGSLRRPEPGESQVGRRAFCLVPGLERFIVTVKIG